MDRLVLGMLPLLLASAGCSVILTPGELQCQQDADCAARGFPAGSVCTANVCEHQCQVDADCAARGLTGTACMANVCVKVDPVWGCLGHVVEPVPDPSQKVTITEKLNDTSQTAVPGAKVDVCAKLDPTCVSTDPNYPKGLVSAADGTVSFSVIQGFDGFVRITANGFVDSRVFVGRPVVTPPAVKSVRLIQTSEFGIIAGAAKQTIDPMRGTAILYAVDCSSLAAAGVSFTSPNADAESQLFYLINQYPTIPPTATKTDVDGFGGIINLPTGPSVANSVRASDQKPIGQSSFDVLANTISYVQIAPTPM